MAAGLRSLLAWWLGGASANISGQGTSQVCIEHVRVYPAVAANSLRVFAAVEIYPNGPTAKNPKVYPAVAGTVTVGCTC